MPPCRAHFSKDPAKRVALCGAAILGIPAFGDFVRCAACVDLGRQGEDAFRRFLDELTDADWKRLAEQL